MSTATGNRLLGVSVRVERCKAERVLDSYLLADIVADDHIQQTAATGHHLPGRTGLVAVAFSHETLSYKAHKRYYHRHSSAYI